jgi:hypothetical protein
MIFCLDFHAPYRCHHAAACCHADWPIPFEDGSIAARDTDGACTFFDNATCLCSIHRTRGVHALPVTCRMFPRIVLHDARGTFVSLSHFCPTAASLLFQDAEEVAIVEAPLALAGIGDLDGLDARGEWPPLLRAGVLMDVESYGAWEMQAIAALTRGGATPHDALAMLDQATAEIAAWTPGSGALVDAVHTAFDRVPARSSPPSGGAARPADGAVKRWLTARLFGAWAAYQGDGLAVTLRYLRACLETFTREVERDGDALEAIRRSDLRILHTAKDARSLNR